MPMSFPTTRPALRWMLALTIAAAGLGGCAVNTRPSAAAVQAPAMRDARMAQAADLLQAGASHTGAAATRAPFERAMWCWRAASLRRRSC